jgi:hypothetical protein
MEIKEKLAYLKGLMEGFNFSPDTPERKVISSVVDILDDLAREVVGVSERLDAVDEYVTAIDEDLSSLEETVGVLPDEDSLLEDEDLDESSEDDSSEEDEENEEDEEDEDDIFEVECPFCGEPVYFDSSLLDRKELRCPNCQESFEFEISNEDEDSSESSD